MLADEVLHHVKNEIIRSESINKHSSWVENIGKKISRYVLPCLTDQFRIQKLLGVLE